MNDMDTFQMNYTHLLAGVVCVIEVRLEALGRISNIGCELVCRCVRQLGSGLRR